MHDYLRALAIGKPHWPKLTLAFFGMLIDGLTALLVPLILRQGIDIMQAGGPDTYAQLARLAWLSLGLGSVRAVGIYAEIYFQESTGNRIATDIRSLLYQKMLRLPFSFFDQTKTGDIMSRCTKDVDAVRDGTGFVVLLVLVNILLVVGTVAAMALLHPGLTLMVLVIAPFMLLATALYTGAIKPIYDEVEARSGALHTVAQENISGIRVVKAFSRAAEETAKFDTENAALLTANVRLAQLNSLMNPVMDMFSMVLTLLVLGYGGYQVAQGRMSLGVLVAFTSYVGFLYWPLRQTGWLADMTSKALAGAKRIFALLDTDEQPMGSSTALVPPVQGSLVFEKVWFRYDEEEEYSVRNFTLKIARGQKVAIIGGTGSGKTTVANLVPRFYDPTRGRVLLDGRDLREWPLIELRQAIGFVFQDNFLFSLTVEENLRLGRPQASRDELNVAVNATQLAGTIERLPAGYDTMVGERGIGLSGGERLRVALARALLVDPPILVLDDSTASLDARTENAVQDALAKQAAGKTVLIIAQRVATAMHADWIVVMEQGEIREQGTHAQLLALQGIYATLYQEQMSLFSLDEEPIQDLM